MKKITKAQVKELAQRALESGNPYAAKAIKYMIGYTEMFIFAGQSMTKDQIDEAYLETAMKDVEHGYNERGVGYYDKWYRYTRADEGRAYDLGVKLAAATAGCVADMIIIPCIH